MRKDHCRAIVVGYVCFGVMRELAHCNHLKTKTDDLKSSALQFWRSEADSNIKPQGLLSPRECRCRRQAVRRYTTEVTAPKGE